jgi:hypothetical protein
MNKNTLAGWSLFVAFCALGVSIIAATYTRKQYNLAYEQDQRALALKRPTLDIIPETVDQRHWKIQVVIGNKSDERIVASAISIPSPDGGFITISQSRPKGPTGSGMQMNSTQKPESLYGGAAIPPGETGVWVGTYEISDAFPAKSDVALTMTVAIKYLGNAERIEAITTTRQLN